MHGVVAILQQSTRYTTSWTDLSTTVLDRSNGLNSWNVLETLARLNALQTVLSICAVRRVVDFPAMAHVTWIMGTLGADAAEIPLAAGSLYICAPKTGWQSRVVAALTSVFQGFVLLNNW